VNPTPQRINQPESKEELSWVRASIHARLQPLALPQLSLRKQKTKEKFAESYHRLREGMKLWKYIPGGTPPPLEINWIICSQLVWKGLEVNEADLWEDIPETDPSFLELTSPLENENMPEHVHEALQLTLQTLEPTPEEDPFDLSFLPAHGGNLEENTENAILRGKSLSLNWERKKRRHSSHQRGREIKHKPGGKSPNHNSGVIGPKLGKPQQKNDKTPKGKKKGVGAASRSIFKILMSLG
jgi:hypothetical protein